MSGLKESSSRLMRGVGKEKRHSGYNIVNGILLILFTFATKLSSAVC